LKISTAFPHILDRQYPSVRPDYPLLTILYLLRIKEIDAVPIAYPDERVDRGVFGYSSLPRLMAKGPEGFARLLEEPCERASQELASVAVNEDLGSLLDAFASRRLGFALVHGVGAARRRRSFVSLTDFLGLYGRSIVSTELLIKDVATPIFSMHRTASIRSALQAMFRHGHRRVFISEREFVSDRSVMEYVFSPFILEQIGWDPRRDVLAAPIDTLQKVAPLVAGPHTSLRTAALKLKRDRGQCLVVGGDRVATPWDVVMKPWMKQKLRVE
jgi:CBS domain-containing protein